MVTMLLFKIILLLGMIQMMNKETMKDIHDHIPDKCTSSEKDAGLSIAKCH